MESLIDRLRQTQALARIVGEAPAFLKAIEQLPVVANSGASVIISGENRNRQRVGCSGDSLLEPKG